MIRINLLPFRAARTKENIRRQVSVFILSMILLIVILYGGNRYLGAQVDNLEDRLAGLKKDIARYEEKAEQVEELKKKLAELNKKIDIVNDLKAHREKPTLLLAEITELVVPSRMQLKKLNYSGNGLLLEGIAMDNETIAVFMKRLERSGKISDVDLSRARQTTEYDVEMKSFGINCKLADATSAGKAKK
ncbi:MAG: PilN domain-containing protein [Desulfobacteraceae bacterium]|nr:PilN domain-containing protein [Desulfobacteraceae bacterium]MCF8094542.1 PilN domain-containing protein [Desulfobacteraceae bacterium]